MKFGIKQILEPDFKRACYSYGVSVENRNGGTASDSDMACVTGVPAALDDVSVQYLDHSILRVVDPANSTVCFAIGASVENRNGGAAADVEIKCFKNVSALSGKVELSVLQTGIIRVLDQDNQILCYAERETTESRNGGASATVSISCEKF